MNPNPQAAEPSRAVVVAIHVMVKLYAWKKADEQGSAQIKVQSQADYGSAVPKIIVDTNLGVCSYSSYFLSILYFFFFSSFDLSISENSIVPLFGGATAWSKFVAKSNFKKYLTYSSRIIFPLYNFCWAQSFFQRISQYTRFGISKFYS